MNVLWFRLPSVLTSRVMPAFLLLPLFSPTSISIFLHRFWLLFNFRNLNPLDHRGLVHSPPGPRHPVRQTVAALSKIYHYALHGLAGSTPNLLGADRKAQRFDVLYDIRVSVAGVASVNDWSPPKPPLALADIVAGEDTEGIDMLKDALGSGFNFRIQNIQYKAQGRDEWQPVEVQGVLYYLPKDKRDSLDVMPSVKPEWQEKCAQEGDFPMEVRTD